MTDIEQVLIAAAALPGTCVGREVRWLYHLALQAPSGAWLVELGTYLGRTLVALCAAAQGRGLHVLSIDNYSYTEQCSLEMARSNLTALGYVPEMIAGDSAARPAYVERVGFLFVDSLHTREHFDAEMTAWLPSVALSGVVACHDYRSPRWDEITGAVDDWFDADHWLRLGLERRLVAFRRIRA